MSAALDTLHNTLVRLITSRQWDGAYLGEPLTHEEGVAPSGGLPILMRYSQRLDKAMGTAFLKGFTLTPDADSLTGLSVDHEGKPPLLVPTLLIIDSAIETAASLTAQVARANNIPSPPQIDYGWFQETLERTSDVFPLRGHHPLTTIPAARQPDNSGPSLG